MGACHHIEQVTCTNCDPNKAQGIREGVGAIRTFLPPIQVPSPFDFSKPDRIDLLSERLERIAAALESQIAPEPDDDLERAVIHRPERIAVVVDESLCSAGFVWLDLNEGDEITVKRADRARAKRPRDAKEF